MQEGSLLISEVCAIANLAHTSHSEEAQERLALYRRHAEQIALNFSQVETALKQERDELLVALKNLVVFAQPDRTDTGQPGPNALEVAEALIEGKR